MEPLVLDNLTLGQRVRVVRVAKRWRQADLAAVAGVEQHEVSRLELDRRVRPNAIREILAALKLEVP